MQIAAGIDPGAKRKAEKIAQGDSFEAIAREWLAMQEPKLAPATYAKAVWTLETLIFPGIGLRLIRAWSCRENWRRIRCLKGIPQASDFSRAVQTFVQTMR